MAGFLTRSMSRIRMLTDEPTTSVKYSDANLIDFIQSAWSDILSDLCAVSGNPIIVRHDIAFSSTDRTYVLPPTNGTILRLAKVNSDTGAIEWSVTPRSRFNPAGPGFTIEANVLRLSTAWVGTSETLRLDYIPTGSAELHEGSLDTAPTDIVNATPSVVLAATPTTGSLDTRPNAYAGQVFRILTSTGGATPNNFVQDRVITAYDVTTRIATLSAPYETGLVPAGTTITYEIAPMFYHADDFAVAYKVAASLLSVEGTASRAARIEREFAKKMRELRLRAVNISAIMGTRFVHDTHANRRYSQW